MRCKAAPLSPTRPMGKGGPTPTHVNGAPSQPPPNKGAAPSAKALWHGDFGAGGARNGAPSRSGGALSSAVQCPLE
eukprot:2839937-Alexandrium_andersonii.AAC.1